MVEIELDGKKVEVLEGSMIMHAAEHAGTYIPHFCYHKKLSIAANCRMCLVDVEKAPKPMPACATPVTQGMVVHETYQKADGSWVTPAEVKIEVDGNARRAVLLATGEDIEIGPIEKMSKSKKNTIDPDEIMSTYGADVARWP